MRRTYDESDVKIRAGRKKRPRTKDRPDYSSEDVGLVIETDRGRCQVLTPNPFINAHSFKSINGDNTSHYSTHAELPANSKTHPIVLNSMKARELGRQSVVVGDYVRVVGDLSGEEGTLARIVEVIPRRNSLARTVDDGFSVEKTIVSNIDQLAIVIAAANPEPRHGFIDRALVVAFDQGIKPIIIVTKCDLADPTEFLSMYKDLEIDIYKTNSLSTLLKSADNSDALLEKTLENEEIAKLREVFNGKMSVLLGHSGVGKSTLVNVLLGSFARQTGGVNDVTGRGRHTSSNASAFELPLPARGAAGSDSETANSSQQAGWIIDTPGVRSFGLSHVDKKRVLGSFSEFAQLLEKCPKNCSHNEAGCALSEIEDSGDASALSRLESLRRILLA